MPTRRLPEPKEHGPYVYKEPPPCFSPDHLPPRPGRYEHVCACGHVTRFTVRAPVYRTTVCRSA